MGLFSKKPKVNKPNIPETGEDFDLDKRKSETKSSNLKDIEQWVYCHPGNEWKTRASFNIDSQSHYNNFFRKMRDWISDAEMIINSNLVFYNENGDRINLESMEIVEETKNSDKLAHRTIMAKLSDGTTAVMHYNNEGIGLYHAFLFPKNINITKEQAKNIHFFESVDEIDGAYLDYGNPLPKISTNTFSNISGTFPLNQNNDMEAVFPCLEINKRGDKTVYSYNLAYSTIEGKDTVLPIQQVVEKDGSKFLEIYLTNPATKSGDFVRVKNFSAITVDGVKLMEVEYYPNPKDLTKSAKGYVPYTFTPTATDPVDHLSVELNNLRLGNGPDSKEQYTDKLGNIHPTLFPTAEEAKTFVKLEPKNYFSNGYTPDTKLIYIPYKDKDNQQKYLSLTLNNNGEISLSLKMSESLSAQHVLKEIDVDAATGNIAIKTNDSGDKYHVLPINAYTNPELVTKLHDVVSKKITATNLDGFERLSSRFTSEISAKSEIPNSDVQRNKTIVTNSSRFGFTADDNHAAGGGTSGNTGNSGTGTGGTSGDTGTGAGSGAGANDDHTADDDHSTGAGGTSGDTGAGDTSGDTSGDTGVDDDHTADDDHSAGADGGAPVPPIGGARPVTPPTPPTRPTTTKTTTTTEPKGNVLGQKSSVGYNGMQGVEAPHINPKDNSISIDIGIKGGNFQADASQKVTLTDEAIVDTSETSGWVELIKISRQNPEKPNSNKTLASLHKDGDDLILRIEDEKALQKCLRDFELKTGKKIPITDNILYPKQVLMSDNNELQGVQIDVGDGKSVTISFDAAGMRIINSEKELNEDGTPKLDKNGKPITHEDMVFLSAGTRPLDFTINPQFLHEASTVTDPTLPNVSMDGKIADHLMIMSILQEREKAENTDALNKNAIISRTFGQNKEIKIDSVPVFEEGAAEPYYLNIVREKGKAPRIFLDMKAPKQGTKEGADLAPKFYEITEVGIEAKSVQGALRQGDNGKAEGFGLYLGIKSGSNKIRLNIPNLAATGLSYDSFIKNGIIDYLDSIHDGADGYGGFKFNELKSEIIGYRQKATGVFLDKLPDPLPAGTTEKDYMAIHSRAKTNTNTIKGTNTIANLQNVVSDIMEEEPQDIKDFVYEPKIVYDSRDGKKLEFDAKGTTSIELPMDPKFGFQKDAAQKVTLVNGKNIEAGVNDTVPANGSNETIISVTDPQLGGETINFQRNVSSSGNTSYTMNFDTKLFQQMLEEYKKTNNRDFDLDLSKLTSIDGKIKFDIDKIVISDDMKIQGVEIKAAGKTLAIDITAAGYMISNGKQVARHRMDKQPLDFTFNASILNDAETNKNFDLQSGNMKDELQVMAIQQARYKAGEAANDQPVMLKYGNLTLYSLPVKTGDSTEYLIFRQEKGKTPELYADLKAPKGFTKLAPKFSKVTHLNMEAIFDKDGKVKSSGLYLGERKNQTNSESIRVEVNNVDFTNETNQGLISVLETMKENSGGNFHLNEHIPSTSTQPVAVQGYCQIDTDPVTHEKTYKMVQKPEDGDDPTTKSATREYQPVYSIGGEKSYHVNWDKVAQLKNNAQKETVEKEPEEEKKPENWEMPKVPKRKKKKVNEYMSSLTIIGLFCLSSILAVLNPFFLIISAVFAGALLAKESGLLAAISQTFGPRDRDALDVHNDIVNTRSKIVELDREISDLQAAIDLMQKRVGMRIDATTGKIRYQNLIVPTNIVDANGKPIDITQVTVTIDANGKPVIKDKNNNPVIIKNTQGFSAQQLQDIINNQNKLVTTQNALATHEANSQATMQRLYRERADLESLLRNALDHGNTFDAQGLREDIEAKQNEISRTSSQNSKTSKALQDEIEDLKDLLEGKYNQDFKDLEELKKRMEARKKLLAKKRDKARRLSREGQTYELDYRKESTDDKGNYHSGTDHFYNFGETVQNDAANLADSDYTGNADNVTKKSGGKETGPIK